jgi:phosphate transport system substrate-binding protein
MRRIIAAAVLIISMCLLSSCTNAPDEVIIVAGSTSVQPYAEILAEEFMRLNPNKGIDIQGGGSSAGIIAAESGTAEVGMSSRNLHENELELKNFEMARDGLAMIVHPKNPIAGLTLEETRRIYAAEITNWSQLGGNDARIHIIAREEGSGTRSAFEELVMDGLMITPRAIIQDSNGAIRQLVAGDIYSIGFISAGLVDDTVKPLKLDGFAPTVENLRNGSYQLYRPFLFVTDGWPTGLAKEFIDFTLSPAGQGLLIEEGLVSLMDD